jgi:hypothetical protein
MTTERFRIKAYWRPRQESTWDCAGRLVHMLVGLAKANPAFGRWNKKAKTRAAANRPAWAMPPDLTELTAVFEKGRRFKDVPPDPWPEMGYVVSAWNGCDGSRGTSFQIFCGVYADWIPFPNHLELPLKPPSLDNAGLVNSIVLKRTLLSVATAWEPDYAVVLGTGYWEHLFGDGEYANFRSGWMTYLAPRYAARIAPPPAAIAEPVANGGLLLLATEERFSMDNPDHVAVADAIQAALAPLQDLVPPPRDADLRRRYNERMKGGG